MTTQIATSVAEAPVKTPTQSQIKVQFTTKHPDIALPENSGPILIPTNLRRYGLSTLVNHLLGTSSPTPLDFLISGSFLRTSIDDYLTANGLSTETSLSLEYVRALTPPQYRTSFQHDDWVSCVDILSATSPASILGSTSRMPPLPQGQARILSGSYDGLLRIWNASTQELLATSPSSQIDAGSRGSGSSVKAAKFLSPTSLVSSAMDGTIRVWKYTDTSMSNSTDQPIPNAAITLAPSLELLSHRISVDALSVHPPSNRILSASTDNTIRFWSSKKSECSPAPPSLTRVRSQSKRRKTGPTTTIPQRGPLSTLSAHSSPVSSVLFASEHAGSVAYSTSWDHSLRTWDLETSTSVDARTTSSSLLSLTELPAVNALAAGSSARHIVLIDPRASATTVAAMTLKGHRGAVVSLSGEPHGGVGYGLVSGSHDGSCRIWDVRSRKSVGGTTEGEGSIGASVYTIEREEMRKRKGGKPAGGEGIKVFGVAWDQEVGIVSAGEDKRVQVNRGVEVGNVANGDR
ncbi:MAG: ribosome biogenesis protein ytm1 [Sclerophora amabilis]|nr:MAG: ribosome biogenesis protein ytm1 [Sclerophora amabilis]